MNIFRWLFPKKKRYRIVHDPELGYSPQYFDYTYGWLVIESSGTLGMNHSSVSAYSKYWVPTEKQAGDIINKHAIKRGQRIVWSG